MYATTRSYAGVPADERKADRRERLLDAGLQLMGTDGVHQTTVRNVCAEARLNPRYFYESFTGIDELLVAVFDRLVDEAATKVTAVMARGADGRDGFVHRVIEAFVESTTADPRVARVLYLESYASEALHPRRFATARHFAYLVAATPEDRLRAEFAAGGLVQLIVGMVSGSLPLTRAELIHRCTELTVATMRVRT